jgi:hypothetical protein
MDEKFKYALRALYDAIAELKRAQENTDKSMGKINTALEKQNFFALDAGEVVDRAICEEQRGHKQTEMLAYKKSVKSKLIMTWVVVTFILSLYGAVILFILNSLKLSGS